MLKTRDPLRVDPIYYVNIDGMNHNAFADAVMDVGDPPCVANNCDRVSKCAEEGVECFAFRIWVNNGGDLNEKQVKKMGKLLQPCKCFGDSDLTFLLPIHMMRNKLLTKETI